MPKQPSNESSDMWIRPRSTNQGNTRERGWDDVFYTLPSHSRYLELADIAFGLKKPPHKKKKITPAHDTTRKTKPYLIRKATA